MSTLIFTVSDFTCYGKGGGKKPLTLNRARMDKQTDRHTHTRQNLYILATRAVILLSVSV